MKYIIAIMAILFCLPTIARDVEVTGRAMVFDGNVDAARQNAINDALYQASLEAGVNVSSSQILQNFSLTKDKVLVKSSNKIKLKRIISEDHWKEQLMVKMIATITPEQQCTDNKNSGYRKTLAVTGFNLLDARQGSLGALYNVESKLSELLTMGINNKGNITALGAAQFYVNKGHINAPTFFDQDTLRNTLPTKALGSQFVMSGVVRDLSMITPGADKQRFYDEALDAIGFGRDKPIRQFVLDVFIHDSFSGALIFQQAYVTQGLWNIDEGTKVGFATPQFWKQDYGRHINNVLQQVVADVDNTLACQPYMGKIASAHGNQLRINSGTASGLRPGDQVKLYRTRSLYDANQKIGVDIQPTQLTAKIIRVLPTFSLAEMKQDAYALGIQQDDVVMIK
jgi:hypothetical protein